ncbi:MAG TPA: YidC/Oxa1 family membrane protein insertase [Candidatus Nanoarchaeia archaeon]|nr:YidC/Oxa1 family membrane protein insertase [Candidatus Nanoarchaeia archaeon]
MVHLLTIIFYQPLLNLLIWLYDFIPGHDIGISIIALTVIIRAALLPLSKKTIESQKALQDLQPKIEEIKKQFPGKEEQGKAMIKLYQDNKINPLSSCLPLLIQLPFLIAVYQVFRTGLMKGSLNLVYPFIQKPDVINVVSFGFLNLSKPNWVLAVLAGAAQFWQAKMMITKKAPINTKGAADENMTAMLNKQMLYFMPIFTIFIGISLPGGLTLYWLIVTLLTVLQQIFIFKRILNRDNKPVITVEASK